MTLRYIITGIVFLAAVSFTLAQTRINATMTVDTVQREFIVVRPSQAPPVGGYPVVFMFHGTSGDGEKFYNISGWKEKGEAENFVTVFPSALSYCFYTEDGSGKTHVTTKWKNGEAIEKLCPNAGYMKDDIKFIRRMIDTITTMLQINRRKIYASGFSNGGAMTSKLMVEMSDVFAAITCGSGPLNQSDSSLAKRSLPFWFILGTDDPLWLLALSHFGLQELPFNDSTANYYLAPMLKRYLGALSLTNQYKKDSIANVLTYTFSTPSSSVKTNEFKFSLLKSMAHVYPNGANYPLIAANVFWEFYKKYSLPLTSVAHLPATVALSVYPNPASDFIVVKGAGEITFALRNVLGQNVFTTRAIKGERIDLPQLTSGAYIAEVLSGNTLSQQVIAIR